MDRSELNVFTLSTGLRLVTQFCPGTCVDYFGLAAGAGSAMEKPEEFGLAHFVEHTIFKGTLNHSANYILNRIEEIGGELNAFTNKEETVVYTIVPTGFLKRSADLVADIVTHSTFPDAELDNERAVILEEIDSYLDSPSEAIFDELDEYLFKGSNLAHNILGTKESISTFNSDACRLWLEKHFTPSTSVVFYSGALPPSSAKAIIERAFERYNRRSVTHDLNTVVPVVPPFTIVKDGNDYHQSHVVTAFRLPGIDWEFQPELLLLANMLGGPGMNSLLNIALREKRGLVYQVDASTAFYSHAGSIAIYYGCDHANERKCQSIVERQLRAVAEKQISGARLSKAVRQYLGQLAISSEHRENRILSAARSLLCRDRILTYGEFKEKLLSITPERLQQAARYLAPEKASHLTLK